MKMYVHLTAPHLWSVVDKTGRIVDDGSVTAPADLDVPAKVTELIGVVPGEAVVIHHAQIPARDKNKVAAAVPYALEEQLATDVEELFFAVLGRDRNNMVTVAVTESTNMEAWLDTARQLPRPVDKLVPEFALLPLHPQAFHTAAVTTGGRICIRSKSGDGLCLDRESVALWWRELHDTNASVAVNEGDLARELVQLGGNLISQWEIGATFPEWLRYGHPDLQTFNLLQGQYAPAHGGRGAVGYKAAAALLIVAILVKGSVDAYDYFALKAKENELHGAMAATLQKAFPGARIQAPGSERRDMESRTARLQGSGGAGEFQALLAALSDALKRAGVRNVNIEAMNYRNRELVITCSTDSFNNLNKIKQALQRSDYVQADLASSSSLDNKVTGKFALKPRPGA